MNKLFFTAMVVLSAGSLKAQFSNDYLKAADNYYRKGDYYSAAQYYEKWLEGSKSNKEASYNPYAAPVSLKKTKNPAKTRDQVVYQLAESYRLLHFPAKAAPYYQQVLSGEKGQFPLAGYYYGVTLKALQNYVEAEKAFRTFLEGYPNNDQNSEVAKREIKSLEYIAEQLKKKDLQLYALSKDSFLNAKGATYAPAWQNNTLLFTSTRQDQAKQKDLAYINRVYEASYAQNAWSPVRKTDLPQEAGQHQGVISVSPDGNTLFLTRWTIGASKKSSAIYSSKKT